MNSLFVIAPYDYEGLWVFDDGRVGLRQEPFVGGADTMIDAMVADIPEKSGNIYRSEELGMEGWLCPALFKYFESAPAALYLRVEAKPSKV